MRVCVYVSCLSQSASNPVPIQTHFIYSSNQAALSLHTHFIKTHAHKLTKPVIYIKTLSCLALKKFVKYLWIWYKNISHHTNTTYTHDTCTIKLRAFGRRL